MEKYNRIYKPVKLTGDEKTWYRLIYLTSGTNFEAFCNGTNKNAEILMNMFPNEVIVFCYTNLNRELIIDPIIRDFNQELNFHFRQIGQSDLEFLLPA